MFDEVDEILQCNDEERFKQPGAVLVRTSKVHYRKTYTFFFQGRKNGYNQLLPFKLTDFETRTTDLVIYDEYKALLTQILS